MCAGWSKPFVPTPSSIFCVEKRSEVEALHPAASFDEIGIMLRRLWGQTGDDARAPYVQQSGILLTSQISYSLTFSCTFSSSYCLHTRSFIHSFNSTHTFFHSCFRDGKTGGIWSIHIKTWEKRSRINETDETVAGYCCRCRCYYCCQ